MTQVHGVSVESDKMGGGEQDPPIVLHCCELADLLGSQSPQSCGRSSKCSLPRLSHLIFYDCAVLTRRDEAGS